MMITSSAASNTYATFPHPLLPANPIADINVTYGIKFKSSSSIGFRFFSLPLFVSRHLNFCPCFQGFSLYIPFLSVICRFYHLYLFSSQFCFTFSNLPAALTVFLPSSWIQNYPLSLIHKTTIFSFITLLEIHFPWAICCIFMGFCEASGAIVS